MSKGNTFETDLLNHLMCNADIALVGDATGLRGSSTAGSLYYSLHTADVGEAGDQTTNEETYTNYARVAVARNNTQFTVASGQGRNTNAVVFPTGGASPASPVARITHWALGTSASGTGKVLYKGAFTTPLVIGPGVAPQIDALGANITED